MRAMPAWVESSAAQAEGDVAGDGETTEPAGRRGASRDLQRLGQRQPRPDRPRGCRDARGVRRACGAATDPFCS